MQSKDVRALRTLELCLAMEGAMMSMGSGVKVIDYPARDFSVPWWLSLY